MFNLHDFGTHWFIAKSEHQWLGLHLAVWVEVVDGYLEMWGSSLLTMVIGVLPIQVLPCWQVPILCILCPINHKVIFTLENLVTSRNLIV